MCLECASGFHSLCEGGGCSNCHETQEDLISGDVATLSDEELSNGGFRRLDPEEKTGAGRRRTKERTKNDINLKDPHSTGRKRAVTLHGHANPEEPCEWQGKANCGGGRFPILGCLSGTQENLHHGPDKNTLNNERTNIHKICSQCHNRWHTLNDPDYEWDGVHEHHAPREPEIADVKEDNKRWKNRTVKRAPKE